MQSQVRELEPARRASRRPDARLMVVGDGTPFVHRTLAELPELLEPGDVLVVNDAATLPASLSGEVVGSGEPVEIRLAANLDARHDELAEWVAVVMGEGDWRRPTEERPPPPRLEAGDCVVFGGGALVARVTRRLHPSGRLVELALSAQDGDLWRALYAHGRPIQYAYHEEPLAVWDQQTLFSGPPVALEPPSSAFHMTWSLVERLLRAGVEVVPITHGTGLSTTGDDALDAILPLPELTFVSPASAARIGAAVARGGRVIAVGTGVVRALESVSRGGTGELASGWSTSLTRLDEATRLTCVDGLLTGMHAPGTSHARLLSSFVGAATVGLAWESALHRDYLGHEYGDLALVWRR